MATNRSTTTRRTLHYYWQVTRKHFGLFAALMASTFLFVALLSYGNPYVMSLVVDRVSAGSVEPDQVFAVYSPLYRGAHRHQRARAGSQQASRLHHVQA